MAGAGVWGNNSRRHTYLRGWKFTNFEIIWEACALSVVSLPSSWDTPSSPCQRCFYSTSQGEIHMLRKGSGTCIRRDLWDHIRRTGRAAWAHLAPTKGTVHAGFVTGIIALGATASLVARPGAGSTWSQGTALVLMAPSAWGAAKISSRRAAK